MEEGRQAETQREMERVSWQETDKENDTEKRSQQGKRVG